MAPGDTARLYHDLTPVSPASEPFVAGDDPRLVQDLTANDAPEEPGA